MDNNKENHIKLHILESLARSQRAVARIIESIADISESSQATAAHVSRNIEVMNKYQQILAEKIIGIRINRPRKGLPKEPWLHEKVKLRH